MRLNHAGFSGLSEKAVLDFYSIIFSVACGGEFNKRLAPWSDSNSILLKKDYGVVVADMFVFMSKSKLQSQAYAVTQLPD